MKVVPDHAVLADYETRHAKYVEGLEAALAARDAVIREMVDGMASITGSGGISKTVHITVDHSTWTKALALVGGEKGEGR